MPEKKRVYTPGRLYDIQVKIKDLDYSSDMVNVTVSSSLSTAYLVITLTISIDPNDIIVEELFGGDPIKLGITLLREDKSGPRTDIELMYVSSSFDLTMKDKYSKMTQKDRVPLNIITVARTPYQLMNTLVNKVFIGKTLKDVIQTLGSDVGATIEYDTTKQNTTIIPQLCIPPTTLYKIIKEHSRNTNNVFDGYLDQRFGLFKGTAGVFCGVDNKIYIKNLTSKLQKDQTFTIYELSVLDDENELKRILQESTKGNTFYTYTNIQTDYSGNAKFAKLATELKHIVRPNDTITTTLTQELKSIAKEFGLQYKGNNLFIDKMSKRTRYYNEDTGFDKDPNLFNARFGRSVSDAATISIDIERNLPVLNLLNVGECVKFKPKTIEYQDLEGKYILWSSQINFENHGDWETTATVNLIRTNKKK